MFWHETQENDINIFPYNKADFLKLTTQKNINDKEKNSENIWDLTSQFQIDTIVSTDWGPGKIISVNRNDKKVVVKIEGEEKEFNMSELRTTSNIIFLIYFKNLNMADKRIMFLTTILASETVLDVKKKVAALLGTSDNCVTLVRGGTKITNNNQKFSENRFYEQEVILAVVNGLCDY